MDKENNNDNVIYIVAHFYARCPKCNCDDFKLRLDGPGNNWEQVLGTECSNPDCSYLIDWVEHGEIIKRPEDETK